MTSIRLVDPLHQIQLLQLFKSPVDGHQAQPRVLVASLVENVKWAKRARAVGDDFDDRTPGFCQAIAISLKACQPFIYNRGERGDIKIIHELFQRKQKMSGRNSLLPSGIIITIIENGLHFHLDYSILLCTGENVKATIELCYS